MVYLCAPKAAYEPESAYIFCSKYILILVPVHYTQILQSYIANVVFIHGF